MKDRRGVTKSLRTSIERDESENVSAHDFSTWILNDDDLGFDVENGSENASETGKETCEEQRLREKTQKGEI